MIKAQVKLDGGKITVKTEFGMKPFLASLPCGLWNHQKNYWEFPHTPLMAQKLLDRGIQCVNDDHPLGLAETWADEIIYGHNRVLDNLPQPKIRKHDSWNHQLQAYHFGVNLPGLMLAMDMGTGKSKVIVDIIQNNGHMINAISCPKSAVGVWPREFEKWWGSDIKMEVVTLNLGSTKKNLEKAIVKVALAKTKGRACTIVVNHEAIWRGALGKWVLGMDWDFGGIDESHKGKNPGGEFGKFIYEWSPKCKQRACLTGTPMPHSPLDFFAQYRFLEPALLGSNAHQFRQHFAVFEPMTIRDNVGERWATAKEKELTYTVVGKTPPQSLTSKIFSLEMEMKKLALQNEKANVHEGGRSINRIVDIKNAKELSETFHSIAYRCMADDVLDLPPLSYSSKYLQMTAEAYEIYNDMEDHFFALVGEGKITIKNGLTKILRCRQVSSGFVMNDDKKLVDLSQHKKEAIDEILSGVDEPIVAFCNFNWEVEMALQVARDNGLRVGEITGRRHDLTATSEYPEDIDFMAVNMQSGGAAIDLTRAALAIDISPTFALGDWDQSRKRLHRPGQERPTRFIKLMTEGTIEPVVYRALEKRRNVINAVLEMRGRHDQSD